MKKVLNFIVALLFIGAASGCNKDKIEELPEIKANPEFRVNPDALNAGGDISERTISYVTNIPQWSASCNASWVEISPGEGSAGSGTLTVTIKENPDALERDAVIKVGAEGSWTTIPVHQAGAGYDSGDLPEPPGSGWRIYVLDQTGWNLHLYIYGENNEAGNNLIGNWPGRKFTGKVNVGPYTYLYLDIAETEFVDGTLVLEFNDNGGAHHSNRELRPRISLGGDRQLWYIVYTDHEDPISDPLNPGVAPPSPDPIPDPGPISDITAANAYVYDISALPEVYIHASEEEWNKLLAAYDQNPKTKDYVKVDVEYRKGSDVTTVTGAGLRLKGNTSRRRPEDGGGMHHFHFYLNYHKFEKDEDHTIHGVRNTAFKFAREDPSYVREHYCYDLFRRFGVWTALLSSYSRVWIKVGDDPGYTYLGVYLQIEHVDKSWMRARKEKVASIEGNLWKCRYQSGPADLRSTEGDFGPDDNVTNYTYELKTNTSKYSDAKAQIDDFITKLNSLSGDAFDKWISSVMDIDLFLKTYAVNVAVGMWDDYWNNSNNYYLYFNSTDRENYQVFFIPYDYDNTLGTSSHCGVQSDAGRQDPYHWGPDDNPLMGKILKNSAWKALYRQYLQELCAGAFNYSASAERIKTWQKLVSPYVNNDTGEDTKIEDRPASWGNHGEYRLLSDNPNTNFFLVKSSVVTGMK